jgi:fumarate reductase (CoM/CoB) subunit B
MEKIKVTLFRYNPETDAEPKYEKYEIPFQEKMTVLDVLRYIREKYDSTLAYSYECRYGYCGSCAVRINKKPRLACRTLASNEMLIEPLANFPVIRDLVVDRSIISRELIRIRPFLERIGIPEKEPEDLIPENFSIFRVVSRCISCLSCMSSCPTFTEAKNLYSGPLIQAELGRFSFDPRDIGDRAVTAYEEGLFYCAMCSKCFEVCPYEIDLPNLVIVPIRRKLLDRGIGPTKTIKELESLLKESGKAFIKPTRRSTFLEGWTQNVGEGVENKTGLFIGCLIDYDYRLHDIAYSAISVLEKVGVKTVIPKNQVCCGFPMFVMGYGDRTVELMKRNIEAFKDCRRIVTLCAGCLNTLRNRYSKLCENLGLEYNIEVYDFSELMAKQEMRKDLMNDLNMKITYHDPCESYRGAKVWIEPREIISKIRGVELLEMEEPDRCCGGNLKSVSPKLGYKIAARKVYDIKKLNVDAVVTSCPRCITQLSTALERQKLGGVKVLHLAQLLNMAFK